eukprot:TRINITY_DN66920_c2_g2_i9.p1 TRINITY_DN66920_c2_g2~~TRINITY_DN66920_c2_g2_i9.p1  ORF type:complete len:203 (+),score=16.54 TRINITY_DN66920_c2_g2_i9:31-639(+)
MADFAKFPFPVCHLPGGASVRPLSLSDTDEWFAIVREDAAHLHPFLFWADSPEAIAAQSADEKEKEYTAHVNYVKECVAEHNTFPLSIVNADQQFVGLIEINMDFENKKGMISYWISSKETGKGLVTAACNAVLDWLFLPDEPNSGGPGVVRVELWVCTDNKKSIHLAERLGFTLEGTARCRECLHGKMVDHHLYSKINPKQ